MLGFFKIINLNFIFSFFQSWMFWFFLFLFVDSWLYFDDCFLVLWDKNLFQSVLFDIIKNLLANFLSFIFLWMNLSYCILDFFYFWSLTTEFKFTEIWPFILFTFSLFMRLCLNLFHHYSLLWCLVAYILIVQSIFTSFPFFFGLIFLEKLMCKM